LARFATVSMMEATVQQRSDAALRLDSPRVSPRRQRPPLAREFDKTAALDAGIATLV
jgi:hypothetical protein